jgi:Ala-tRNA(Pro) deacylase
MAYDIISGVNQKRRCILASEEHVYSVLDDQNIEYEKHNHPPVFTVEEANEHWAGIKGAHTKNLFFRNKKGNRHFLVILDHGKSLDIKKLQTKIGAGTLSFASDRRLDEHLGLTKGAVSAFGLINDEKKAVEVMIDKDLMKHDYINFHPNINTATITISTEDFKKFLDSCGNKVTYISI